MDRRFQRLFHDFAEVRLEADRESIFGPTEGLFDGHGVESQRDAATRRDPISRGEQTSKCIHDGARKETHFGARICVHGGYRAVDDRRCPDT